MSSTSFVILPTKSKTALKLLPENYTSKNFAWDEVKKYIYTYILNFKNLISAMMTTLFLKVYIDLCNTKTILVFLISSDACSKNYIFA